MVGERSTRDCKLDDRIWYGDKTSITEETPRSIINIAHKVRRPYWSNVGNLHHDIWYFKMASPDRELLAADYWDALSSVIDAIARGGKCPILCHCQMGAHRGPSAALFAYWHLSGRDSEALKNGIALVRKYRPDYAKGENSRRGYQNSMLGYIGRANRGLYP